MFAFYPPHGIMLEKRFAMKRITLPLAAALIIASCLPQKREPEKKYTITFFIGDVKKNNAPIAIGDAINEKDIITTGGSSSCDVRLGGSLIRIKEKTSMQFSALTAEGGAEATTLGLDAGKLLCKPKKLLKEDSFTIKTPTAVAGIRGTQFTVETDANRTTRVRVFEGKVKVTPRVTALDSVTGKLLDAAPTVESQQSIIITREQSARAEAIVAREIEKGSDIGAIAVAKATELVPDQKSVRPFKPEEFIADSGELIRVAEKPAETIKTIKRISAESAASGDLAYVTSHEIYLIRNGRVEWEGQLNGEALTLNGRIFAATPDRVIAINKDGSVLWDRKLKNQGMSAENGVIRITIDGKKRTLNTERGSVK
jgi:hypothetical protein